MTELNDLLKIVKEENPPGIKIPILASFARSKTNLDLDMIKLAYDFAAEAHKDQKRKSGEPYITHCLETAITLAKMGMDQETIIAGLLHDVPENTDYTLVDVEKNFGSEVAQLVAGITKLGVIKYRGIERFAENLRKMFISMAKDIRVIVIKMADRLHNLETLEHLAPEKQKRIAQESLEIYAPIANRLGMGHIRGMIEDLAFPYVYPEEHTWMMNEIMPKVELKKDDVDEVIKLLKKLLKDYKIKYLSVHGRPKRLYSLYKKLIRPQYNRDISKIHDLVAIRVIVKEVADCYNVLGLIHQEWKPLPGRIKDYISQPKPNGYQSLHTTVFGPDGKIAEFQIRTEEMHKQAEFGIASHWQYKEFNGSKNPDDKGYTAPKKIEWIQELVDWQKEMIDNQQFLDSLSVDVFNNRIFVFTPEGDVMDLPEEATPVDFAYHIHSWIGNHCTGARVNGQLMALDTKLKNGDVVEIITEKNRKGPSRDWLKFVKTGAAKSKIRSAAPKK